MHRNGSMTNPATTTPLDLDVLRELSEVISARKTETAQTSYTAKLLHGGIGDCAKKLGEEAVETVIAAVAGDGEQLAEETADLLYHLLVTLEAANVPLADVMAVLRRRQGLSGLDEKASRTNS